MKEMILSVDFFGKNLRRLRRADDITQECLATKLGVTSAFICHLEKGIKKPSVDTLIKSAAILDVNLESLVRG